MQTKHDRKDQKAIYLIEQIGRIQWVSVGAEELHSTEII